jgi:hypothetical protein
LRCPSQCDSRYLLLTFSSLACVLLYPYHYSTPKMLGSRFWSATPALSLLATLTEATVKPYISTVATIRTECKTCPRSLCPNLLYYDFGMPLNVTCWTRGTNIMGDRLWLQSTAGCYVTEYDLNEYSGQCRSISALAKISTESIP